MSPSSRNFLVYLAFLGAFGALALALVVMAWLAVT